MAQKEKAKKKEELTIPANKKGRHMNGWLNFFRAFVAPSYWLVFPYKFVGKRRVGDGAHLYVCNHYRAMDFVYPYVTTPECPRVVARSKVEDQFFISWVTKKVKTINVNRDGKDARAIMDCLKCLKNGEKVVIFPEGTRNRSEEPMLPFKGGAAVLAIKGKVPIQPMVIYEKPKPFRMTYVLMGEPFELSEYYGEKLTEERIQEADEKIRQVMLNMREEHRKMLEEKKNR